MTNLTITNPNFYSFKNEVFTIDILGGIDINLVERLITTLRIVHKDFPPIRHTLDLYSDEHTEKLKRKLCTKFELNLIEVSTSITNLTAELEEHRLQKMKMINVQSTFQTTFTNEQKEKANKYLRSKNLLKSIANDLQQIGILGESENALTLFLSMNSFAFHSPFSVLCLAKSGIGKSYLLQKLSECMPKNSFSLHTQLTENALYYFDNQQISNKTLLIEDLDWTENMLRPLATLQTQKRLIKTRATKDKNGHLHATTFELKGNLCLVACAYSDKNYDQLSLPFLVLHLNHSPKQDENIMTYQKKIKAGLIDKVENQNIKINLQNCILQLQNYQIINPYATLINLPKEISHPRKSLLLLLNFIDIITYFHQFQRQKITDKTTGEVFLKTHPLDIENAFRLLKNSLFRRADELSTSARGFYNWLKNYLEKAKVKTFFALDIRTEKRIHPRTLNRYLNELTNFHYLQIVGGNRYRGGYSYKISNLSENPNTNQSIEQQLQKSLEQIWKKYEEENVKTGLRRQEFEEKKQVEKSKKNEKDSKTKPKD